jgi:hypothetical protein
MEKVWRKRLNTKGKIKISSHPIVCDRDRFLWVAILRTQSP